MNKSKKEGIIKLIKEKIENDVAVMVANRLINQFPEHTTPAINASIEVFAGAFSYLATRKAKCPIHANKIQEMFEIEEKDFWRVFKRIKKIIGIKNCASASMLGTTCITILKAENLLGEAKSLKLSDKTIECARQLIKKTENQISGKPATTCAAAIYIAATVNNQKRTQQQVAEAFLITGIRDKVYQIINIVGDIKIKNKLDSAAHIHVTRHGESIW